MNPPSARFQLLVTLVAMVAIGAIAELVLRAANLRFDTTFYIADSQLGWALRPGLEGWMVSEGHQFVRINSDGMRAREFSARKPSGTLRIAVLGNSWTEALQVPMEKDFCSVLERKLSGSPCAGGRRVEVLNFGVSGYAMAQELLELRTRVWKYNPDIVLVAFYTARDVLNNVRQFNTAADPAESPYFKFSGDRLVLDDSFRSLPEFRRSSMLTQRIRSDVDDNVRILQTTSHVVRLLRIAAAKATLSEDTSAGGGGIGLEDAIYSPLVSPAIANAWKVTERLLLLMRDEAASHNTPLLVVTLANRAQVNPDAGARRKLMETLGVGNLDYPDERLQALGASAGIAVTSLAHRLSEYAQRNQAFLNGFPNTAMGQGHWNELGHRVAGEAIADDVCSFLQTHRPAQVQSAANTPSR